MVGLHLNNYIIHTKYHLIPIIFIEVLKRKMKKTITNFQRLPSPDKKLIKRKKNVLS